MLPIQYTRATNMHMCFTCAFTWTCGTIVGRGWLITLTNQY